MTEHAAILWNIKLVYFEKQLFKKPFFSAAYPGPIMINVHTDYTIKGIGATGAASNPEEAINIVRSGAENGFRLTYNLNGNCYRSP